jgi:hypothetical protein
VICQGGSHHESDKGYSQTVIGIQTYVRTAAWVSIFGLFIVTDGPIGLRPISHLPIDIERFLALVVVGGLFAAGYPKRIPEVLILLLVAAGLFEFMQFAGLGRHGRLADFSVKAIGACCGVAAGALAEKLGRY